MSTCKLWAVLPLLLLPLGLAGCTDPRETQTQNAVSNAVLKRLQREFIDPYRDEYSLTVMNKDTPSVPDSAHPELSGLQGTSRYFFKSKRMYSYNDSTHYHKRFSLHVPRYSTMREALAAWKTELQYLVSRSQPFVDSRGLTAKKGNAVYLLLIRCEMGLIESQTLREQVEEIVLAPDDSLRVVRFGCPGDAFGDRK